MPRTKRKDKSRAVLRTGESQRADGTYQFRWTDSNHKRFCVYAKTLDELRYKEEQIKKDKSDGIKTEARYTTVNEVYELWKELKRGLSSLLYRGLRNTAAQPELLHLPELRVLYLLILPHGHPGVPG